MSNTTSITYNYLLLLFSKSRKNLTVKKSFLIKKQLIHSLTIVVSSKYQSAG